MCMYVPSYKQNNFRTQLSMHLYIQTHTYTHSHTHTRACSHTHTCVIYTEGNTHTQIMVNVHACFTYINAYRNIHIETHDHMFIGTYTQKKTFVNYIYAPLSKYTHLHAYILCTWECSCKQKHTHIHTLEMFIK